MEKERVIEQARDRQTKRHTQIEKERQRQREREKQKEVSHT